MRWNKFTTLISNISTILLTACFGVSEVRPGYRHIEASSVFCDSSTFMYRSRRAENYIREQRQLGRSNKEIAERTKEFPLLVDVWKDESTYMITFIERNRSSTRIVPISECTIYRDSDRDWYDENAIVEDPPEPNWPHP